MRALASRFHPDLASAKVVGFNFKAIADELIRSQKKAYTVESAYYGHIHVGQWFARRVADHLYRQDLNPGSEAFFGFNTGCLETLQILARKAPRMITVVDQIDPGPLEEELVLAESDRWPGSQNVLTQRACRAAWRGRRRPCGAWLGQC